MVPSLGIKDLASQMRIEVDEYGFLREMHPKLSPVESATPGIFIAGCAQIPMDIKNTVAQADAVAGKALKVLARKEHGL